MARLGGDEFAVLLENITQTRNAANIASKLNRVVSEEVDVDGFRMSTSASIGISVYPEDGELAPELSRTADIAMYSAKDHGRNTFEFYSAELTEKAVERLAIENDLRHALTGNNLFMQYQPQFYLAGNRLFGMQALIRWNHPAKELILPERFIDVARESGLMRRLDEWVLGTVLRQVQQWRCQGLQVPRVSINISAQEMLQKDLCVRISEVLRDIGLDTTQTPIEIEVTESMLQRGEQMLIVLRRLHELGMYIAIDDFGTGYSSLGQLQRLPVDTLKIDKSFSQSVDNQNDCHAIVKAIISMGHSLGLNIVAGGVETQPQLLRLRNNGCDVAQGFFLGRPMEAAEICAMFQALD